MKNNNCYSKGELGLMRWSQKVRGVILTPLLSYLEKISIKPDHITVLSLITGLSSAALFYFSNTVALLMIFVHVLLDSIDGPLARHTGKSSNKGSFADSAVDQTVLAAIIFVLINLEIVSPIAGGIHILLYTIAVGFAMIRNSIGISYSFLLRPRFFFYIWLVMELFFYPETINYLLWACNIMLIPAVVIGFIKIRNFI